jgi:hypothetical protein
MLSKYNENIASDIQNKPKIILQQHHFQFDYWYYKQNTGLAMGSPTSIIA